MLSIDYNIAQRESDSLQRISLQPSETALGGTDRFGGLPFPTRHLPSTNGTDEARTSMVYLLYR